MKQTIFKGSGVAIITPMLEDGSVNYPVLKELLEQQIAGTDNWNDIFIQFDYNPLQAY